MSLLKAPDTGKPVAAWKGAGGLWVFDGGLVSYKGSQSSTLSVGRWLTYTDLPGQRSPCTGSTGLLRVEAHRKGKQLAWGGDGGSSEASLFSAWAPS